ncbi:MAG TPA: chitooligosaccharide deacetylase, partial [Ruminococcaceae bacterium]|nr:chitooligosaccharide deacetylase [Oscillospiraceae bacterium]
KGYSFIPVSDMIYREDYVINHEGRQISMKD